MYGCCCARLWRTRRFQTNTRRSSSSAVTPRMWTIQIMCGVKVTRLRWTEVPEKLTLCHLKTTTLQIHATEWHNREKKTDDGCRWLCDDSIKDRFLSLTAHFLCLAPTLTLLRHDRRGWLMRHIEETKLIVPHRSTLQFPVGGRNRFVSVLTPGSVHRCRVELFTKQSQCNADASMTPNNTKNETTDTWSCAFLYVGASTHRKTLSYGK